MSMYIGKVLKRRNYISVALASFAMTLVLLLLFIQMGLTVTGLPEWAWGAIGGAFVSWAISMGTRLYKRYCYSRDMLDMAMEGSRNNTMRGTVLTLPVRGVKSRRAGG